MSKRLYVAYGSNLNIGQMSHRCPNARLYGTGVIEDYELQFKGSPTSAFATIAPKEGSTVPVAVWEIDKMDEKFLDHYEGYPSHYFKQDVPVKLEDQNVTAMVYIMNLKMEFGMPSSYYYRTVHNGYTDCGLDTEFLDQAVLDSAKQYYAAAMTPRSQLKMSDDKDIDSEVEEIESIETELEETDSSFGTIPMCGL